MRHQPQCFGKLYSVRAKECQICQDSIECWQNCGASVLRSVIKSGYTIAVIKIISGKKRVTVNEIKQELVERFSGKELNVYYYLGVLKKHGLIDVEIEGRQRFYSLR